MMLRVLIGIGVGGLVGYGWYRLVGCPDGTCPLTRNPYVSSVYGALVGALVAANLR